MKYIIDIPGNPDFIAATYLECGLPAAYKNYRLEDLEPYTEPDREDIGQEVWDFVKEIIFYNHDFGMEESELEECFGFNLYSKIFKNLSYSEAKAKYDAWKAEKEKIHIGDEVEYTDFGDHFRFVVTGIDDDWAYGFRYPSGCNDVGDYCNVAVLTKTGRHFDCVEELLKQMKKGV